MQQLMCLMTHPIHLTGDALLTSASVNAHLAYDYDDDTLATANAVIHFTKRHIGRARQRAIIANPGASTDKIALDCAHQQVIPAVNAPGYSVAKHTPPLMLALARHGNWPSQFTRPTLSLYGKPPGGIRRRIGTQAKATCGMRVSAWSPRAPARAITAAGAVPAGNLATRFATADIVNLHRPLRPRPDSGLAINNAARRMMKPGALLINISPGGLTDEKVLYQARRGSRIAAAGLDAFARAPLASGNRLAALNHALSTPDITGSTRDARQETHQPANNRWYARRNNGADGQGSVKH